jgi:RNA 3'-terminal phosphate cyclase (ATP)
MGPRVELVIDRAGFAPRGGGKAHAHITPTPKLKRLDILARGPVRRRLATATVAGLPRDVAERELKVIARVCDLRPDELKIDELPADQGPGNLVHIEAESAHLTEVFTAFGARGKRAEDVAREAARDAKRYLDHDVPVDEHLADQLLLPMSLAAGGAYLTGPLSLHSTTNIETIRQFLDVPITVDEVARKQVRVSVE